MEVFIGVVLGLILIYCAAGAFFGFFEMKQTDKKFDKMTIIMWLPRLLGVK